MASAERDRGHHIQLACTPCGAQALYMLESRANLILVTCAECDALYWVDTKHGVGNRPEHIDLTPQWPTELDRSSWRQP